MGVGVGLAVRYQFPAPEQSTLPDPSNVRLGQKLTVEVKGNVPDFSFKRTALVLADGTAAWVTALDNRYFARAMVNRTWWRLFGRGIVNPVDDMHAANAPSHPELLERFADSGFDLKFLTRAIVSSRAYQRTSRRDHQHQRDDSEKQVALFGRMSVKVVSAGQLYDSLVTILGQPAKLPGTAPRSDTRAADRARQLAHQRPGFLSTWHNIGRWSIAVRWRSAVAPA
jgi:hypothetical protein